MLIGISNGIEYLLIKADIENKRGYLIIEGSYIPCWCTFDEIIIK